MIGLWVFVSTQVWAAGGPIVVHREFGVEDEGVRERLDSVLDEGGYAGAEWLTPSGLAATFEVYPLWAEMGVECEGGVELRVWLERLDRMEMRVQILDIETAQELGERIWRERVCLQSVPARRDLQRLLVTTGRAQLLAVQTSQTEEQAAQARSRVRETMHGLGRLGHDLVLPPGLEPELQELMPRMDERLESLVVGAGPQGRLAIDGQRLASGVVRRKPGKHLVQVEDASGGLVSSARVLDLEPGRALLWAGELEDGALEAALQAALVGTSTEPELLKAVAQGLGSPLFFFSLHENVPILRRYDGSVALTLDPRAGSTIGSGGEFRDVKLSFGIGPSIGGSVVWAEAQSRPEGMGGLTGWARWAVRSDIMLVGNVGYLARQDPLPAQMEAYWLTSWAVPVRVGLRFLPRNATWETGVDGVLRWEGGRDVAVKAGGSLVLGRTADLGTHGVRLRTEARAGAGLDWLFLGLQTGVEVPW